MTISPSKIRAIIVDDSSSMRELLKLILSSIPGLSVAGIFETAEEAWPFIRDFRVDLLLLDLELPGRSGLELLNHCRQNRSIATIVVSARIVDDPTLIDEALSLGAVAAFPKPDGRNMTHDGLRQNIESSMQAWQARLSQRGLAESRVRDVIAIGASTGGVPAVQHVLGDLKRADCPIVITQHMSSTYTPRFAESIGRLLNKNAFEARTGMVVANNAVYVAPGDQHMRFVQRGGKMEVLLGNDAPVAGHRPSVDAMFQSLSEVPALRVVALLLTGMGNDGAAGMLRLRAAGAHTIVQDERSSVVFGMPRAAMELNAAVQILPLAGIGHAVMDFLSRPARPGPVALRA